MISFFKWLLERSASATSNQLLPVLQGLQLDLEPINKLFEIFSAERVLCTRVPLFGSLLVYSIVHHYQHGATMQGLLKAAAFFCSLEVNSRAMNTQSTALKLLYASLNDATASVLLDLNSISCNKVGVIGTGIKSAMLQLEQDNRNLIFGFTVPSHCTYGSFLKICTTVAFQHGAILYNPLLSDLSKIAISLFCASSTASYIKQFQRSQRTTEEIERLGLYAPTSVPMISSVYEPVLNTAFKTCTSDWLKRIISKVTTVDNHTIQNMLCPKINMSLLEEAKHLCGMDEAGIQSDNTDLSIAQTYLAHLMDAIAGNGITWLSHTVMCSIFNPHSLFNDELA